MAAGSAAAVEQSLTVLWPRDNTYQCTTQSYARARNQTHHLGVWPEPGRATFMLGAKYTCRRWKRDQSV